MPDHACRQIAHDAQLAPGKRAVQGSDQRSDAPPEQPDHALGWRSVVAPVAAAAAHRKQAVDGQGDGGQARQLRAHAMTDPDQRLQGKLLLEMRCHQFAVLGPVQQVGPGVAQRHLQRQAMATVVEGRDAIALLRQPAGKGLVIALLHAHGASHHHLRQRRCRPGLTLAQHQMCRTHGDGQGHLRPLHGGLYRNLHGGLRLGGLHGSCGVQTRSKMPAAP
ncbi:hypothetical protein SDC9_171012 [bioreactor metagenome]|uniref:Uncharacterized protein n=1 Tax=bioreactor metagenome TaxID=1076179 RepID=A0A645GCW9_9ZZZZ